MDFKNIFIISLVCMIVGQGIVWSQETGVMDTPQSVEGSETGSAMFGYDQLRIGGQTSQASDQSGGAALASSDYVLGPGDVIAVTIYGNAVLPRHGRRAIAGRQD